MKEYFKHFNLIELTLLLIGAFVAGYTFARDSLFTQTESTDLQVSDASCEELETQTKEETETFFTSCGGFF